MLNHITTKLIDTVRFFSMNVWFSQKTTSRQFLSFETKKKITEFVKFQNHENNISQYGEQSELFVDQSVDFEK